MYLNVFKCIRKDINTHIHMSEHRVLLIESMTIINDQYILPIYKYLDNYYIDSFIYNRIETYLTYNKKLPEMDIDIYDNKKQYPLYALNNPKLILLLSEYSKEEILTDHKNKIIMNLYGTGGMGNPLPEDIFLFKPKIYDEMPVDNFDLIFAKLNKLENENSILKEKLRECKIEIHYLKSCNLNKKVNYNYEEIKQKNKKLNSEFKRVYKLISKNIGYNLISN